MALTESIEYESLQHGVASFAIKKYTVVKRDGVEISRSAPMTIAANPEDDINMYPEEIQGMLNGYWTDAVKAARVAQLAKSV